MITITITVILVKIIEIIITIVLKYCQVNSVNDTRTYLMEKIEVRYNYYAVVC